VYTDRLGSIGKYYPYGQERPSATTNGTEKFATYFRDAETGLDYADQRYHMPGNGRFLTPDPAGNGSNWYSYVGGDPINNVDPSGLCSPSDNPPCYSITVLGSGSDPGSLISAFCFGFAPVAWANPWAYLTLGGSGQPGTQPGYGGGAGFPTGGSSGTGPTQTGPYTSASSCEQLFGEGACPTVSTSTFSTQSGLNLQFGSNQTIACMNGNVAVNGTCGPPPSIQPTAMEQSAVHNGRQLDDSRAHTGSTVHHAPTTSV